MVRRRFFNEKYDKLIASQMSRPVSDETNHLQTVTILNDAKIASFEELSQTVASFRKMGIKAYGYFCTADPLEDPSSAIVQLNKKDASWYAVPNQSILIEWLSRKTDLLIAINPFEDLFIRYLIAASNSRLKASLDFNKSQLDLNIDFYVKVKKDHKPNLLADCKLIYRMLGELSVVKE